LALAGDLDDAGVDESVSNIEGSDGVDSQGNDFPPEGATSSPRGCGDDEVHRVDDTTIDFSLATCGSDDAFRVAYNVVGEDPAINIDYRRTNIGLSVAGEIYPSSTTLELTDQGIDITDSDDDGVVDSIENGTIPLGNGLTTTTDPNDPDTDGDGLTDYQEIVVFDGLNPIDADTDNDGLDDGEDPQPLVPQSEASSSGDIDFVDASGEVAGNAIKGAVLGDAGVKYEVDGSKTLEYYGGWLTASIAPTVDVAADTRDCLVLNSDIGTNVLDCGGAVISAGGSIGTVVGTLTAPTGLGAALGARSFAVDTAEDITDVATITARFVKYAPESATSVGRVLDQKIGSRFGAAFPLISSKLSPGIADDVRRGVRRGKLVRAGLDEDTARALEDVLPQVDATADEVAQLTTRIDGFDGLAGAEQQLIVQKVTDRIDITQLSGAYDGQALARITGTLDPKTLSAVLKTDNVAQARRLVGDTPSGAGAETMSQLSEIGDDALNRFLRLDDSLKNADDIDELDKSAETLGRQIRTTLSRAAQDSSDRINISPRTIDEFSDALKSASEADIDGVATQVNSLAGSRQALDPVEDAARREGAWSNAKGDVFELLLSKEFGYDQVVAIGRSPSGTNYEMDLLLKDGIAIEAKSGSVGDIEKQLDNLREAQQQAGESGDLVLLANNPSEISGVTKADGRQSLNSIDGLPDVENGYVEIRELASELYT